MDLKIKITKQEEDVKVMKSTISVQIATIAELVEENLKLKASRLTPPTISTVSTFTRKADQVNNTDKAVVNDCKKVQKKEIDFLIRQVEKVSETYYPAFTRYNSKQS